MNKTQKLYLRALILTKKKNITKFANKNGDSMECQGVLTSLEQKGFKIIPPDNLTPDEITIKFLEAVQEGGIIGRNILRDILIRKQYFELKQQGKSSYEAREIICASEHTDNRGNKYYIGEDTVKNILYNSKKRH